jgi:hypothetical protein
MKRKLSLPESHRTAVAIRQAPAVLGSSRQSDADVSARVASRSKMQAQIELLCTSKPQHLGCSTSMITPPLTCDPGRADRVNLPRVLSSHEEATVRCAKARLGSNPSSGSQAPVRSKTPGPHSILPMLPVFINRCGAGRHVELIPSVFIPNQGRPRGHKFSFLTRRALLGICPRSHSHHKISGRCRADIFNAVLVVGMNKSHRAWADNVACAIDRELYGTFPNEPHFAVHVMMWSMRHPARR